MIKKKIFRVVGRRKRKTKWREERKSHKNDLETLTQKLLEGNSVLELEEKEECGALHRDEERLETCCPEFELRHVANWGKGNIPWKIVQLGIGCSRVKKKIL